MQHCLGGVGRIVGLMGEIGLKWQSVSTLLSPIVDRLKRFMRGSSLTSNCRLKLCYSNVYSNKPRKNLQFFILDSHSRFKVWMGFLNMGKCVCTSHFLDMENRHKQRKAAMNFILLLRCFHFLIMEWNL